MTRGGGKRRKYVGAKQISNTSNGEETITGLSIRLYIRGGKGKRKHLKTQKIKKRRNKTAFSYKVVFVYVLQKLQGNNDF